MIEATKETLKDVLKERSINVNVPLNTQQPEVLTKPVLNPPQLQTGTNFIKDLTDLVKAGSEFLNTELGQLITSKINPQQQKKQDDGQSFYNEMATAPREAPAIETKPQEVKKEIKPEPKKEQETKQEQKLNAEEIYLFSYSLIENLIKNNEGIKGEEILTALKENKADLIKKLNEVFKNENIKDIEKETKKE